MSNAAIIENAIQGYRASPQQERLWLLTRDHERTPYRAHCGLRIEGAIDAVVVKRAVRQVVERHEILRTTFQYLPGMILPVQVIHNGDLFAWEEQDLTGLSKSEQQATVETLRHGAWTRPLDFSCGPLLNLTLLTLGRASYLLMVTLPALCADSATLGNVAREIARACARGGDDHGATDACIQYADFSEWQHALLDADGDSGRTYWHKQALSHSSSVFHTRLPFELSTTESLAFAPLSRSIDISADLVERINELAESTEASVAAVFLACWQVLLDRLTDQPNIRIGAMCDNRIYEEFERALGPFSKFLPVYCRVEREQSTRATLAKFHLALTATRKWQEYFVWDEINPSATDALNRPFFHFCFEYDEQPVPYVADGISIDCDWSRAYTDRFKVMLGVMRKGSLLEAALHYDASIYPAGSITTLADYYETLLSDAVCRPDEAVMQLRMLNDAERRKVLYGFNQTQGRRSQDTHCLHELIEAQVIRTPEAKAVVCGDQSLSYVELDRRANQLARYLLSRGVGPDVLVAISVERSTDMVVGLLGILKAGGAYVPIDPGYPKDRIRVMLEDSRASLLLTQERLLENLPAANVDILCLDREWPLVAEYPVTTPKACVTSSNLAYVIFTSGSTGRPKGVMVSHDNVVQSTRARSTYYHEPIRSFLLFSSFAFDSSVAGLFWTLSTGGCLCIPNEETQKDPLALSNLVSQRKVSHLLCLPSFYAVLLHQITQVQAGSLCTVIVAGEACPTDVVAQHYVNLSQAHLFNEYGPTEGTVWSSVYQVGVPDRELTVPIGSPIAHTQIYVLDTSLEPVPIGISGELYIGGAGLARGYLNRPELTAERFIPNPFSEQPGERLYRTGDLARYRVDGNIEYIGRTDHQVKVRGFRIELGEVEARLLEQREVKEAVVIVREDTPGEKRLAAYIVGQESVLTVDKLRTRLKETLPRYMVPSIFVLLDALPLTSNGKVDRKALPAPDIAEQFAHRYVAPRNDLEAQLAGIWAEVLRAEQIGIHDNFFDLGGHSLTAVQMIVRLRERFGGDLSLASLFEAPTVAEMAAFMSRQDTGAKQHTIDWQSEATPHVSIGANAVAMPFPVALRAVFVTGATGFLGVFLVQELLQQTQAKIYCLVRAVTDAEAAQKVERSFAAYGFGTNDRVIPVLGNLAKPGLGIWEDQIRKLSDEVDTIYHNGALVNFVYPYHLLNPVNVLGTEEVLRFACLGKLKPVHYVSAVSIFGNSPSSNPEGFTEVEFPQTAVHLTDGYSQSKWVAEKMVGMAGERGIPICIYRPGNISGHSHTGAWNTSDFICRIIRGYVDTGRAPAGHTDLDLAPVDYVSKAIVYLSCKPESLGQTFHLNNPSSVSSRLVVDALRAEGFKLDLVSMSEWLSKIAEALNRSAEHPLYPLASLFEQSDLGQEEVSYSPRIDCKKTSMALDGSGIVCPVIDSKMVHRYIAYFIRSGFLESPLCTAADAL